MKSEHPPVGVARRSAVHRFSSTRFGARLARWATVRRLAEWGWEPGSGLSFSAAVVVAELAANAVLHGRLPGRHFELRLSADPPVLRIEVSDARGECRPGPPAPPGPGAESGWGLLLVDHLAARWGVLDRSPVGKTVWAELEDAV